MIDPHVGYRFTVEIKGLQEAYFTECSGFEAKLEVEEYKEGGLNDYVHKFPGRQSFNNVTLKRGLVNSIELWEWLERVATKKAKKEEKKNMSVVLHNGDGSEAQLFNLTQLPTELLLEYDQNIVRHTQRLNQRRIIGIGAVDAHALVVSQQVR